ncbi:hypothetical protein O0L34_g4499 [Tuta absoluta]|nr:hypothetical protein O0L34_g4499 [Tuta absoluta]
MELQNNLSPEEKARIQRKLVKYTRKYTQQKENRNPPWVPTQKMARMLFSSASAMRKFQRKAECMGIDTRALQFQHAQVGTHPFHTLTFLRRKTSLKKGKTIFLSLVA